MPNYCTFTLKAAGPAEEIEACAANWNSMMRDGNSGPEENGVVIFFLDFRTDYPEVPEDEPVPYYDRDYMGCKIENGMLHISAIANWGPPLTLIGAISSRWPNLEFVLGCTVEHELNERWYFKSGEIAVIDLWHVDIQAHEDEEAESWYVRKGDLLRWPESHRVQWKHKVYTHPLPDWVVVPASDQDSLAIMEKEAEKVLGFCDGECS